MININTTSDVPIYTQIRNEIIREIASGNLQNGDEGYSRNSFEDELKLLLMEAKIRGKSQKDIKNIVEEIIK